MSHRYTHAASDSQSVFSLAASIFLVLVMLCGTISCGHKMTAVCPFSEAGWNSSSSDIISLEGTSEYIYPSVYNGQTYTYPKIWRQLDGTVKYMFDDSEQLSCISWSYQADSAASLKELYDSLKNELDHSAQSSGVSTEGSGNYGTVWYLKRGNIILSAVSTDTQNALQCSYISPVHSEKSPNE